jgi:hypothetical protein
MPSSLSHRLIILSGSGPGAGKSATCEWLIEQLKGHSIPAHWIYEDHVLFLPEFANFVRDIKSDPKRSAASLIKAIHQFVVNRQNDEILYISDSLFPCTTWFYGAGYRDTHIIDLSDEIMYLLAPLRPIVFHLQVSIQACFSRASKHRGELYFVDHLHAINNWPRLRDNPIHDKNDMMNLFTTTDQLTRKVLERWPEISFVVDASGSFEELQGVILEKLNLEKLEISKRDIPFEGKYIGRFVSEGEPTHQDLIINKSDDNLMVNRYWPTGCRLVYIDQDQFRLQGTDHTLTFITGHGKKFLRVCHMHAGEENWYRILS